MHARLAPRITVATDFNNTLCACNGLSTTSAPKLSKCPCVRNSGIDVSDSVADALDKCVPLETPAQVEGHETEEENRLTELSLK